MALMLLPPTCMGWQFSVAVCIYGHVMLYYTSSSDSSGISLILVVLLGASVLLNALLTCALSYSSQRTKSRYDIKL